MKKTAKIIGILIAAAFASVLLFGCGGNDDDDGKKGGNEPLLTSEFASYFLTLGDFGLTGADNTIHLKNKSAAPVGIEIQKIYVSKTKSLTDADTHLVWDFTAETPNVGAYWGFDAGTKADGKWTSGEVGAPEAGGETYITGFGSGAAYEYQAVYWIFIAKNLSNTVKGDDVTIEVGSGDPYTATVSGTFAELFTK
ncbi:MAG: hypothetical protein LBG05_06755 [Treponema sp.]|nr:hypothetical protein [Treponema sp.]